MRLPRTLRWRGNSARSVSWRLPVAACLVLMARDPNCMVHFYDQITDAELFDLLTTKLADIDEVIAGIRHWLARHPERVADAD